MNVNLNFPNRIICLTEESVETLALLDKLHLVVGASSYVKRPDEAKSLPKVSLFTSSNYKKILELRPDLVIGFSDIQKDIARELNEAYIGKTIKVLVEGFHEETELLLQGRHQGQAPDIDGKVIINEGMARPGDIVDVEIIDVLDYDLVGRIVEKE